MTTSDIQATERNAEAARRRVQADIAALGNQVRADRDAAKSRVQDNAAAIAGGAAALGIVIGAGGRKAVQALVGLGMVGAAAYFYMRSRE
ncbi:MAG TPA: hypothetical protein VF824_08835 [Thermoanaerobaculia bacterium]|jgi:hypothetical protein